MPLFRHCEEGMEDVHYTEACISRIPSIVLPTYVHFPLRAMVRISITLVLIVSSAAPLAAQPVPTVTGVEPQPVYAQAMRLAEALEFLGSPLSGADRDRLEALEQEALTAATNVAVQEVLDPYVLAFVDINPEGRVKVERGSASAALYEGGWTSFLVKVQNQTGVTARLEVESPNASPALHRSTGAPRMNPEHALSAGQLDNRFLELHLYRDRPLQPRLSGLKLEYLVLQVYSKDAGRREAQLGFNIGQGSQDIGFRNTIDILFDSRPSTRVVFRVKDADGSPTMASFVITDGVDRFDEPEDDLTPRTDYRVTMAQSEWRGPNETPRLQGIYPLPSRRLAGRDPYPDFFFHPQIYRADGEHVTLPAGTYRVRFTRGPEYIQQSRTLVVPPGVETMEAEFQLQRWTNLAELGWFSGDHHIHAAGCSHYESPEEGVLPEHMFRQIVGEDLNIGASLAWGPCWYYQKEFFTGKTHPMSTSENLLRQDVEVSGFPSSHAGHVVLLRIQEDDYPGTTKIEEWPSWTLPVLEWARDQGGAVGYAHSGWGLEPVTSTEELPNYVMPKMDGIGANEYIVTVTQGAVDFYSAGDTPAPWELNMWYHSLNSGYRVRISGETDFPCIFDERVGLARSYVQIGEDLDYDEYVQALKDGKGYVTEGRSHLIDFDVEGLALGEQDSEVQLSEAGPITVTARANAYLPPEQSEQGARIAASPLHEQPYWHVERARIGASRTVPVELVVNGEPVARREIEADGNWNDIQFEHRLETSSWVALRIYPSAHTNPIFVMVDEQPIRERKSIEWSRKAVDQCWDMKVGRIRDEERPAAQAAYDRARAIYEERLKEAGR